MAGFHKSQRGSRFRDHLCHRIDLPELIFLREESAREARKAPGGASGPGRLDWGAVPAVGEQPVIKDWQAERRMARERADARATQAAQVIANKEQRIEDALRKMHLLTTEVEESRQRAATSGSAGVDHREQMEMLERRVRKLAAQLEVRGGELRHFANHNQEDSGIASIYESVQGLDTSASQQEAKKEMMAHIFEENLKLRRRTS